MGRKVAGLCIAMGCAIVGGCTTETYESGDGAYSYLRADFVEMHSKAPGKIDYAVTDDGDSVALAPHLDVAWAGKADTIYRALLYYSKEGATARPVSVSRVPVMGWKITDRMDTLPRDPVTLESSWVSGNRKYLNLGIILKTAAADTADARHVIGLARDTVTRSDGASDTFRLILAHRQNVEAYYSVKAYLSIPISGLREYKKIRLSIQTYQGEKVLEHGL